MGFVVSCGGSLGFVGFSSGVRAVLLGQAEQTVVRICWSERGEFDGGIVVFGWFSVCQHPETHCGLAFSSNYGKTERLEFSGTQWSVGELVEATA